MVYEPYQLTFVIETKIKGGVKTLFYKSIAKLFVFQKVSNILINLNVAGLVLKIMQDILRMLKDTVIILC